MTLNQVSDLSGLTILSNPTPVMFKLNSFDLSDYFEGYNSEQTLIALEGALNIIFNATIILGRADSELDIAGCADWETVENDITSNVVFKLVNQHQLSLFEASKNLTDEELTEMFSSSFDAIVNKLSEDITGDHFNTDVGTIYSELENFNSITLDSYLYDEKTGTLRVYLILNPY